MAIAMPRGELMIVALLAMLQAGAAYLPVDPGYPAARRMFNSYGPTDTTVDANL